MKFLTKMINIYIIESSNYCFSKIVTVLNFSSKYAIDRTRILCYIKKLIFLLDKVIKNFKITIDQSSNDIISDNYDLKDN